MQDEYNIFVKTQRGRYSYLPPERNKFILERSLGESCKRECLEGFFVQNAEKNLRYKEDPILIFTTRTRLRLVVDLPSLKSLKKRKEKLTQEIAERKKAYAPLREESRRLEIASDNVYSIFRKTNEMKSDLAWKREWEANVREKARQEQVRQEQRERQPKRKKRSYDMSL